VTTVEWLLEEKLGYNKHFIGAKSKELVKIV